MNAAHRFTHMNAYLCIHMQKYHTLTHTHMLKTLWQSVPEFGGLRKHQTNPVCTKRVFSLQNVQIGHHVEEGRRRRKEGEELQSLTLSDSAMHCHGSSLT